jgi:hypothetical protein
MKILGSLAVIMGFYNRKGRKEKATQRAQRGFEMLFLKGCLEIV